MAGKIPRTFESHAANRPAYALMIAAVITMAPILLTSAGLTACAVYKAASAPPKKDLSVLNPGTRRDRVIAELGSPVRTETIGEGRRDLFTFVQGYSKGSTSGLAAIIAIEDLVTLGVADLDLGKSVANRTGKKMTVAVYYDAQDMVLRSETVLVSQP